MALTYSKTKFGNTFSNAVVKVTNISINFGRTETRGVATYKIQGNSSDSEAMEIGKVEMEFEMGTLNPEQQVYNYLTGSVSEFSSATNL